MDNKIKNMPIAVVAEIAKSGMLGKNIIDVVNNANKNGLAYLAEKCDFSKKVVMVESWDDFRKGGDCEIGSKKFFSELADVYVHHCCSCEIIGFFFSERDDDSFPVEILKYSEVFIFTGQYYGCDGENRIVDSSDFDSKDEKKEWDSSLECRISFFKKKIKRLKLPVALERRLHVVPCMIP